MAEKKKPTGDYDVGYCRPPKAHRFKKGRSGILAGAPSKQKQKQIDISGVLNEPVKVNTGGKKRNKPPFEAGFRQLAKRALEKDLRAILKFVRLCEEYGVIAPPPPVTGGGVVIAPKGVNLQEWVESITEEVPIDEA